MNEVFLSDDCVKIKKNIFEKMVNSYYFCPAPMVLGRGESLNS